MSALLRLLGLPAVAATAALLAFGAPASAQKKLTVAADVGFAPHVLVKPAGGYDGYNVDMYNEIARRMGRELEIVDQQWSGIFAGLNAGRYDLIMAPTTVTAERAKEMLFMEGYLDTDYRFLVHRDSPEITSLEDLKDKAIAVNRGNLYDQWATARADQYGWTMQRFGKNADAIQAVLTKRAFANLAGAATVGWAAKQNPMLKTTFDVKTGQVFSSAFRKDDTALRNEVETVVECMKLDGFFAELNEKWFGVPPAPGAAATTVHMGFGQPGFEGYDPTPHRLQCS